MAKKIVKVYGHIRSGNHALAAFVQKAFYPNIEPRTIHRAGSGHWSRKSSELSRVTVEGQDLTSDEVDLPYGHVVGNHLFPKRGTPPAIYVYRDGRDVALSIWRWEKMRPLGVETFSEFLRLSIDWRFSQTRRFHWPKHPKPWTVLHHWMWHVNAWTQNPNICCVRYEDFVTDPLKVQRQLVRYLRRDAARGDLTTGMAGWNASSTAKVSRWKAEMSAEDVAFCNELVPVDFVGRWGG